MNITNNIDNIQLVKIDKLNQREYLKTLINEGYNVGILNDRDIINIQNGLLQLLDKITYKYNGTESSSIRKEILEKISNSNIYTIGIYLKEFKNPDDAVKFLKEESIEIAYLEGRKRIEKILNIIRVYYVKIKQNKLNVGNIIYDDTILEGIKGFLKIYNPDFNSQDMKITADYPLFNNLIGKLDGVEFIEQYVKSINLENNFTKMFAEDKIKYLLMNYLINYKELIINIFEIVLLETFACKLAKRDVRDLIISKEELNKIYNELQNMNEKELENKIKIVYYEIKKELLINDKEMEKYIEKNFDYIIKRISNLLKEKSLDKIFITEKYILE